MRIGKEITPHFEQYDVFIMAMKTVSLPPCTWWQRIFELRTHETIRVEKRLDGILEADDSTGLIVQHMTTERGDYIYI